MSDGTLRALGVLVALYQNRTSKLTAPPLVGIEEPESAINPGAAGILVDALFEASLETQVIVTTHSPDLIDHPKIGTDNILAVESRAGETFIAPVDSASVTAVRDRLYSVGELLRQQQIQPDITALPTRLEQAELFRPLMGNGRVNSDHR
jgi:AAA15 family ATPase/GTPase